MKKTILMATLAGILGCISSAWGLGINVGSIPKEYTSYGAPDTTESLTISTKWWNAEWTPVEVSFHSGEGVSEKYYGDGSGQFYFTSFSLNQTNDVLSTLNCKDATLTLSSYAKIQGYLNATNTNITATYLRIASGGVLNMDGGKLNLTSDRADLGAIGSSNDKTYQIYGKMVLNNVEFSSAGRITANSASGSSGLESGELVFFGSTSFKGTELIINEKSKLSVLDTASIDVNTLLAADLTVSKDSKITVDSYDKLGIANLNIILDPLETINFSDIFLSETVGETVVFSANKPNISVLDSSGNVYESVNFVYDESGNLTGISVPEPSTYAAIFGALALAFAAYRRRK